MAPAKSNRKRERLFLLDGMALAYRAYFSFMARPLINSRGENTSAIYGFVTTLMKILNEERPEHIAVVFDTKQPTFRHIMYEPYKATRQKMPEDLAAQMDTLKEVVSAFNVPIVEVPGFEADDIMGTLAKRAVEERISAYLVTGDKDFMQLISSAVKMLRPGKRGDEWETLDERHVREKFGVGPERVVDVLAIIGDTSDNVPGVHGIGEKTAIPLVQEFGTLENIYRNLGRIPQAGVRQKLEEQRDQAFLSKKLVTIDTAVPLTIDLHHLSAREKDLPKLRALFARLEFKSLLARIEPGAAPPGPAAAEGLATIATDRHTYHCVRNKKEFASLLKVLNTASQISFDTETTSREPLRAEIVGLSFAVAAGEAWYVPVLQKAGTGDKAATPPDDLFAAGGHTATEKPKSGRSDANTEQAGIGLPLDEVLKGVAPILRDPSVGKIGQNIKYDALVMASHGVDIRGIAFDTMVANYILRPDGQHNLDALAKEHLSYQMISYDELTGSGKTRKELRDVPVEQVADYSAQDADITLRLSDILRKKLEAEQLDRLYNDLELPLIEVLKDMEFRGVKLDVSYLQDFSKELERTLQSITREIYHLAGEEFNINSTQQLSTILFEKLKLAVVRKTKTGYSTDVGVLETLRHEHPIVEQLLDYRQIQKLKSTYVDALPALIHPRTGRVHTSFNQTVALTGRLSSSDPNLQNIPIRTELGQRIRQAFIPPEKGMVILSADYSQIELRIMAHVSGDEGLREAFEAGEDIHTTTAARVFSAAPSAVTKEMRRRAKEVNFGIMYGIGPFGLSARLDITQTEAKEIIAKYFERFPKVNQYIFDTIASARQAGYVSTVLGRRRYLPDIRSKNFSVRANAERQAINMPIQGTAADMIKLAMISIHRELGARRWRAAMLLQVHDELVFEVARADVAHVRPFIIEQMQHALALDVPIVVEVGTGSNWLEAH